MPNTWAAAPGYQGSPNDPPAGRSLLSVVSASVPSVYLAIPQNPAYSVLQIYTQTRCDTGGANQPYWVQFNGDTASDYSSWSLYNNNNVIGLGAPSAAAPQLALGTIAASGAPANYASIHQLLIVGYQSPFFKQVIATYYQLNTAAIAFSGLQFGLWSSVAPINSIRFYMASGNFIAGSSFNVQLS